MHNNVFYHSLSDPSEKDNFFVILIDNLHLFWGAILRPRILVVAALAASSSVTVQFISEDLGQNNPED
jgi:hypothetical protein